jgi:hypothetical protein
MLARVFTPFSAYLRVILTGLSATVALVLGTVLATAAQASPLKPSLPVSFAVTQVSASYRSAAAVSWTANWTASRAHAAHLAHTVHLQYLAELAAQKAQAVAAAQAAARAAAAPPRPATSPPPPQAPVAVSFSGGALTAAQVGQLWLGAGGPSWAETQAVRIAYCESGYNPRAYNPSGATGVWQILGAVLPGDLTNPYVNAANAVAKFRAAGDSFTPWVCQ